MVYARKMTQTWDRYERGHLAPAKRLPVIVLASIAFFGGRLRSANCSLSRTAGFEQAGKHIRGATEARPDEGAFCTARGRLRRERYLREDRRWRHVMTLDEEGNAPLLMHQGSLGVVSAVFVLGLVFGIVTAMYASRALLTRGELAWVSSQLSLVPVGTQPFGDETIVTLTRTACEGTCPSYEVKLYGSGRVEFRGVAFVCAKTPPATRVNPMEVKRLVDGLLARSFSTMPSYANHDMTDNPIAVVSLQYGGKRHQVEHVLGDVTAPRLLYLIEERVDEIAGTSAWLGVQKGWQRMCTTVDGKYVPVEHDTPSI